MHSVPRIIACALPGFGFLLILIGAMSLNLPVLGIGLFLAIIGADEMDALAQWQVLE
ncbi:hypothetical protein [Deinococcus yavapaiensis]|uniref:Uncharacterized protein n=1 Tax=Deinococcus yavapaiensis KR-236 TaxID=694435 RepID=A0A318S5E4_9DEIO|nr:hypothetical protein [Deinococcus yavapaiensis]PYE51033.1 hypothetical protein DES52_116100 [Deinococcus yavapaiensis KR-236]